MRSVTFEGNHTTAGLDLPKFAGSMARGRDADESPDDRPDPFALRRRCRKPLVMAVQGVCYTIGIEVALAADIVVAAEDARFAQLEPRRGLAVFGGAHVRYVQRAGWGNAMYHLLRADEFDAQRALALGFVQEVVPVGDQIDRALELAEEVCECAPLAVREIKRGAGLSRRGRAGRVPGDSRHAHKDRELGGLRGGGRFVRRASQGEVPRALTGAVAAARAASDARPGYIVGASDWRRSIWQDRATFPDRPALTPWGMKDIAFRRKELERRKSALRAVGARKFEDCGHFVAEEAPGRVVEVIRAL